MNTTNLFTVFATLMLATGQLYAANNSFPIHQELEKHLHDFLITYNFGKRLKSLKGKTPWQFIQQLWEKELQKFHVNANPFIMGLNTSSVLF